MKYSYIKPKKKSAITVELKFVFVFFGVTIFMLFSVYSFLFFKDYRFSKESESIVSQREQLDSSISKMKEQIAFIEKEAMVAEDIHTKNSVLKDSISNLFDLIPQRITLSEAKLLKNGLILYGITPTKDVYNFMLQAPLRSIFTKTYSSFYPENNGWLRFVSTNYVEVNTDAVLEENIDEN